MTKKFTQEEVAEYFKDNGYELLSEYKGADEKVRIRDKRGKEFDEIFSYFKKGHRPENIQEKVAAYFNEHGYELLSEYKGNRELVRVRNANGEEYEVRLRNFKRGNRPERRLKKVPTERVISHLGSEGYEIISTYTNVDAKMSIMCAMGHVFEVSYTNFKLGRRCSECSSVSAGGMSIGERLVWSVLQENQNVLKNVSREVTVYIEETRHRFDFLFKMGDKQFAIEYDGKQHYGGRSIYENPSKRDVVKNNYCKHNNIELIRIPYTVQTLPDVTRYIENRLGTPLALPNKIYSKSIQDVAEYYLAHSTEDAQDKFQLSNKTIHRYFKSVYGMTKREYLKQQKLKGLA